MPPEGYVAAASDNEMDDDDVVPNGNANPTASQVPCRPLHEGCQ